MRDRIRVLVVDDSVVMRRILTNILSEDPAIEVVGTASNGVIALSQAERLDPDVITLDIEMPQMDGLTTLRNLRERGSRARIIMCSTLTSRGASTTLDALILGANDYVTKPGNCGAMDAAMHTLRAEMVPKMKQFFEKGATIAPRTPHSDWPAAVATPSAAGPAMRWRERRVVAIAVSTGGPTALMEIVPQFPATFPLPILIVQHMPPLFTKQLADRLAERSPLRVVEATEGLPVRAGTAVLAPGDHHMLVRRAGQDTVITLNQRPQENSVRPAADVLFRSVAETFGGEAIGVVLTGMGQDGLRGAEGLKAKGAYILAQDRASSVVWGMPGAVVSAGLADDVVDLRAVVPHILKQVSA